MKMAATFRSMIKRLRGILEPLVISRYLTTKPMTLRFPEESLESVQGYRGRHLLEPEKCIGCGICVSVCPNNAIELVEFMGQRYPQIHLGKCCFCALCAEYCPRNALKMTRLATISIFDRPSAVYGPEELSKLL
jgi:formate hydrogenlyase subunit 6/NADH:ubiquinone oxidoreductase subunit I